MSAAERRAATPAKLLTIDASGSIRHRARTDLAAMFGPGDLVVANDAATLPASLSGRHAATGAAIEVRLAAWKSLSDPTHFTAIVFGEGDHRTPTEGRPPPPPLAPGDGLLLGPLTGRVVQLLDHPRLIGLRFAGTDAEVWAGIARHGKPIQYAHAPEPLALWDVWTRLAARPIAFEAPSAGFALDWRTVATWRARGIAFATLTHAAGISSTGDPVLDRRLPLDELFHVPRGTAIAVRRTKARLGRVIAIGTTVVRALEAAATEDGALRVGDGVASNRLNADSELRVADAILSGIHQPGDSHYALLSAFAGGEVLERMTVAIRAGGYRDHEFGDSVLIERQEQRVQERPSAPVDQPRADLAA